MDRLAFDPRLARETAKSVLGGLIGSVVFSFTQLGAADPAAVQGIGDITVVLLPAILVNALMSALIPALIILWRSRRISSGLDLLTLLAAPATVVLTLAITGTVTVIGMIHLVAFALSLSGLTASGIMLVGTVQAVVVAVTLTPLTIILLSSRISHG